MRVGAALLAAVALAAGTLAAARPAAAQAPAASGAGAGPRLVVAIAVDQLRADYMDRFRPFFGRGGFNLFLQRGAHLASARYEHATTSTCPGHAVMLTGSYGAVNGIIGNDWYDVAAGREVYCAADTTVRLIGADLEGRSPRNLEGATVGDLLKMSTGGRSRVLTVSAKDRSAIMLGGHLADAAYWMEDTLFVTSTYYRSELPKWAHEFNGSGKITAYFGKQWERLLPTVHYAMVGPDDVVGEAEEDGLQRTFPHAMGAGSSPGEDFVEAFDVSPFGNDVLADFAMRAIVEEGLGRDTVTDLLGISFSANDRVGHAYGPDSHEVMDVTVRLDRTLARLFAFLDRRVGLGNVVLVLTADHGVAPLPEVFATLHPGASARRFDPAVVDTAVNAALQARYGPAPAPGWVIHHDQPQLYLNLAALRAKRVSIEEAERVAQAAVLAIPGVHEALTATELAIARGAGSRSGEVLSFHPARSGNIYYQMAPYIVADDDPTGTGHGTPWAYDQQVPVLFFGRGIVPGVRRTPAAVADIAPTLSALLGLVAPGGSQGRVLSEILR
ncbi:MAG TPA: alkaline phosphatase family protein [Gemmatimonadales bacterium]|nr:alkaline phosphatase family protein [Gemmatimonadales bacterium]